MKVFWTQWDSFFSLGFLHHFPYTQHTCPPSSAHSFLMSETKGKRRGSRSGPSPASVYSPYLFLFFFIGVLLIYNVVLILGVQQSDSLIHTHIHTYGLPRWFSGKEFTCQAETWDWFLSWEDSLEKEMASLSSVLAWRIPRKRSLAGYSPWVAKSWTRLSN